MTADKTERLRRIREWERHHRRYQGDDTDIAFLLTLVDELLATLRQNHRDLDAAANQIHDLVQDRDGYESGRKAGIEEAAVFMGQIKWWGEPIGGFENRIRELAHPVPQPGPG